MPDLIVATNVPVSVMERIAAAYVELHGPIPKDINGVPTMTPAQFAKKAILAQVKGCVRIYEKQLAEKPVGDAAVTQVDLDFQNL